MNPALLESLDLLQSHFAEDDRCLAMFLTGSIGRGETDAYSDVDVGAVLRDEAYASVNAELRPLCEEVFGPIAVWLPEGERAGFCNYAFLYRHGDEVLLCDVEILSLSLLREWKLVPPRILFDKAGVFDQSAPAGVPAPVAGATLARDLDNYWVYAYLNGKYYRRGDLYKMLYVQDVLFQTHLRVLNALHGGPPWKWWAGDIQKLPLGTRADLLVYRSQFGLEGIAGALEREFSLFAADAHAACERFGIPYPDAAEQAARDHLGSMGVLRA